MKRIPFRWIIRAIPFLFWLTINIRVEAGCANSWERAFDGFVGTVFLLIILFRGVLIFQDTKTK